MNPDGTLRMLRAVSSLAFASAVTLVLLGVIQYRRVRSIVSKSEVGQVSERQEVNQGSEPHDDVSNDQDVCHKGPGEGSNDLDKRSLSYRLKSSTELEHSGHVVVVPEDFGDHTRRARNFVHAVKGGEISFLRLVPGARLLTWHAEPDNSLSSPSMSLHIGGRPQSKYDNEMKAGLISRLANEGCHMNEDVANRLFLALSSTPATVLLCGAKRPSMHYPRFVILHDERALYVLAAGYVVVDQSCGEQLLTILSPNLFSSGPSLGPRRRGAIVPRMEAWSACEELEAGTTSPAQSSQYKACGPSSHTSRPQSSQFVFSYELQPKKAKSMERELRDQASRRWIPELGGTSRIQLPGRGV